MATKSIIHSNAFNFLSFVQNSVDPRTGQYTFAFELPSLVGNDLIGPQLPLRLAFNPLNNQDTGFGTGWSLALTQYVPGTHMLTLHTGESFKVTGSGPMPSIREKKLDTFHFHDDSADGELSYRVVHKSGLVEVLKPFGDIDPVALPVRVLAPSGHHVTLTYIQFQGKSCLASMVDGNGLELLKLTYTSNPMTIDLHPSSGPNGEPIARYTLELSNRQLRKVTLPTADGANWRFDYASPHELTCLSKLWTPTGAVEEITYDRRGHQLPGGGKYAVLPRVERHVINPGCGQPSLTTTYTYTYREAGSGIELDNNFVGNNGGITWQDDGLDNLYRVSASYKYATTATHWITDNDGKEVVARTVERQYNRFHLLEQEITRQAGHVLTDITTYHGEINDAFERQPLNFQLPRTEKRMWTLEQDASRSRSETTETHYDLHGNLVEEISATGQRTVTEYYLAEQDPEGFVRNRESVTVIPAPSGDSPAPTLRTRYEYKALASVANDTQAGVGSASTWLVPSEETLIEIVNGVEQPALQITTLEPVDDAGDRLRHGRPSVRTVSMGDKRTRTDYTYNTVVREQHPVLITEQTVTGFDHGQEGEDGSPHHALKTFTLEHSILIGEPLLNRDDNDVEIAYAYDALRRVIRETVAPNDVKYKATREYTYYLVASLGQHAQQTTQDVKGVVSRTVVDGLNRVVGETRHDADAEDLARKNAFRERYRARYDGLGQLIEETEIDWLAEDDLPLLTRYEYDDWGQQYCQIGPDGIRHVEQTDPIGTAESGNLPIQTSWSESSDGTTKTGKTVTWINLFEQPTEVRRFNVAGVQVSRHQSFYDGLGRLVREIDARQAVNKYAYDAFDRLVDHTLADNSVVHRDYSPHSAEDLPVKIAVNGQVLGEQAFDGLDRMISSTTGGRKRIMKFKPGQRQPHQVITAAGRTIDYEYVPQLGEEPTTRRIPGQNSTYTHDPENARLLSCSEGDQGLGREYFSTGEVRTETRSIGDESWEMTYGYSLQARILSYTDVLGQEQTYVYDEAGRLKSTQLGSTSSQFSYDVLGQLERFETRDGEQQLTTELEYDDFGREVVRRFIFTDSVQELIQKYTELDQLRRRRLMEDGKLVRDERYTYDRRGRLESYTCEGPQAPVDPYGKTIREQQFEFDSLDNIIWVFTAFDGAKGSVDDNEATYLFDNPDDPAQLTGIENTHPDYPAQITLTYDEDGNLTCDEQQRTLTYDTLGRLVSVEVPGKGEGATYSYDPLDRLASQTA